MEYFTLPELPDKPMFRCEPRMATLQVSACAQMWREAQGRDAPERLDRCRTCVVGAKHAGEGDISRCSLRGSGICARCHRRGLRLVGGHICVSCKNREYEVLKGRNAKGTAPRKHAQLYPATLRFLAGGDVKRIRLQHCASPDELIVAALRDSQRHVVFAFHQRIAGKRQLEVFE